MRPLAVIAASVGFVLLSGCAEPLHLGYDFGRAYTEAFTTQPDLTRPSVINAQHGFEGTTAIKIRLQAEEAASDVAVPIITLGS